ncbi:cupin domain-containing protein [Namhaeicola litoreus]|uniref:Cupin domain-containing protein n=1 Tax=Namhaeicola litoreus TaxID=1052145 RepID=A0ABW3Y121_9FLAO
MKQKLKLPGFILSLVFLGCTQLTAQVGEMIFPEGKVQHVVLAKEMQWKPCPPNLPKGCEMAVLEGNPKGNDFFTVRFKIIGEFIMPPHTHPKDERVTILQGKAYVAFGEDATQKEAKEFGPGDYYVNARNAIHTVWADPSTIIQITGIGPWEVDFIEK